MPKSGNAVTARQITVDGYRLVEQWIELDPWSWIYFKRPLLAVVICLTVGCAHVAPAAVPRNILPPPAVVLVVPAPLAHDLTAWLDQDTVCVASPPLDSIYAKYRCLSMATIRSLIQQAQWAAR